jgi:hypothetical protein
LRLASRETERELFGIRAQQVIAKFKELPASERAEVAGFVVEHDGSWIPDEFKEAMKDAAMSWLVEMETALCEMPPADLIRFPRSFDENANGVSPVSPGL